MVHQPPNRGYAHCIAEAQLRLPSSDIDRVVPGTLQACVFQASQRPNPQLALPGIDQELHTTPALRGSETSRDAVIAKFAHSFSVSYPPEHRADAFAAASPQFVDLRSMPRVHCMDRLGDALG